MNPDLTQTIAQLRGLLGKATPGPWMNNEHYECIHSHSGSLKPVVHYSSNNPSVIADANLITAAINTLPALLAALSHPADGGDVDVIKHLEEQNHRFATDMELQDDVIEKLKAKLAAAERELAKYKAADEHLRENGLELWHKGDKRDQYDGFGCYNFKPLVYVRDEMERLKEERKQETLTTRDLIRSLTNGEMEARVALAKVTAERDAAEQQCGEEQVAANAAEMECQRMREALTSIGASMSAALDDPLFSAPALHRGVTKWMDRTVEALEPAWRPPSPATPEAGA